MCLARESLCRQTRQVKRDLLLIALLLSPFQGGDRACLAASLSILPWWEGESLVWCCNSRVGKERIGFGSHSGE